MTNLRHARSELLLIIVQLETKSFTHGFVLARSGAEKRRHFRHGQFLENVLEEDLRQ